MPSEMAFGGIEAGGTTFVASLAVGDPTNVVDYKRFPTTSSPEETYQTALDWFAQTGKPIGALGIATFGPVCLNRASASYGQIGATPKKGWRQYNILSFLSSKLPNVPIGIDTDVNAAALAELQYGTGRGANLHSLAYITVGTGVGVGLCVDGKSLIGMSHAEAGHIRVPRHESDPKDTFQGVCPSHGDCVEGDPVWDLVGYYLGQLCASICLMVSPERIVLGGGVPQRACLLASVEKHFVASINGYVDVPSGYIRKSALSVGPGVVGSQEVAYRAYHSKQG
ncbi:unnamed protein product (mitochondrion) [Plasmodiophora brassicae]|uniref:fructokinase n=1 Tax=Plasmodiophora brassicae TaxID=37360 RepID=A0A3P3YEN1_PLABS|nr:unnamed protein product [Plasmodiophora brassicae]